MAWLNPTLLWSLETPPAAPDSLPIVTHSSSTLQTTEAIDIRAEQADPAQHFLDSLGIDLTKSRPTISRRASHCIDQNELVRRTARFRQISSLKQRVKTSLERMNQTTEGQIMFESASDITDSPTTTKASRSTSESNSPVTSTSSLKDTTSDTSMKAINRASALEGRQYDAEEIAQRRRRMDQSISFSFTSPPPFTLVHDPSILTHQSIHQGFSPILKHTTLPSFQVTTNLKSSRLDGGVSSTVVALCPSISSHIQIATSTNASCATLISNDDAKFRAVLPIQQKEDTISAELTNKLGDHRLISSTNLSSTARKTSLMIV